MSPNEPQHLDEYEDFKRGERVAAASLMGGQELAEATIDAFLASPQAAEELARALAIALPDMTDGTIGDSPSNVAAWVLAAWQKVRHPEEA